MEKQGKLIELALFRKQVQAVPKQGEAVSDYGDRLQRIRASLEKINRLMAELKKMSRQG